MNWLGLALFILIFVLVFAAADRAGGGSRAMPAFIVAAIGAPVLYLLIVALLDE